MREREGEGERDSERERERGSESEKERGERKLTWVGVNGSLGFCPFWRERKREERGERNGKRKKEKEIGREMREEREEPRNMRERERERELEICIYQQKKAYIFVTIKIIKYKGKSIQREMLKIYLSPQISAEVVKGFWELLWGGLCVGIC